MLDRLPSRNGDLRPSIESYLHRLEHLIVLPAGDPSVARDGALVAHRAVWTSGCPYTADRTLPLAANAAGTSMTN